VLIISITCNSAYFIKLGRGGEWERDCLDRRVLRFGYSETPANFCNERNWPAVQRFWHEKRGDAGVATRDVNQIRTFYESTSDDIFITFHGGALYWCQPDDSIEVLSDGTRQRKTLSGWSNKSINGNLLSTDRLAGFLLKVQHFRGTICTVNARDYLLRKINDEVSLDVQKAEEAENAYIQAIKILIQALTWKDFELLVELVFTSSGWRRMSAVGSTQKTVDIELVLPTTKERAFVQVKSEADNVIYESYANAFADGTYDRMFFVWHTGRVKVDDAPKGISLIAPEQLASMVIDAGLASWVKEKVS